MILDGDILEYFRQIHVDVEESIYEDTSSFSFHIYFRDFDLDASFSINHTTRMLSFLMGMPHPENMENLPEALNALNQNSRFLKAYYHRLDDFVYVQASSFIQEENLISTMDYLLTSVTEIDSEYIENLYYTLYNPDYESIDDEEFDKAHEDTSIEEDMAELMALLGKK